MKIARIHATIHWLVVFSLAPASLMRTADVLMRRGQIRLAMPCQ